VTRSPSVISVRGVDLDASSSGSGPALGTHRSAVCRRRTSTRQKRATTPRSNSQDLWIKIFLSCFELGLLAGSFDELAVDEGRACTDQGGQV
jgi:hypothetical protein